MERSPAWPSLGALCWFTCLLLIRGQRERGRGGRLPETEWSCLLLYSEGMEAFASLTLGILLGVRTQEPAYPSPVGQHVMLCALKGPVHPSLLQDHSRLRSCLACAASDPLGGLPGISLLRSVALRLLLPQGVVPYLALPLQ